MTEFFGMLKAFFAVVNTGLVKFVKSVGEKREEDRYRAERDFRIFKEKVKRETNERRSDLDHH
jgi:hypothetical protein